MYNENNMQFSIEKPHTKLMSLATKIINEVNWIYGGYENYFNNEKG